MSRITNKKVNVPITGDCFCGTVGYRIDGKIKDTVSCHCSRCRKAFSAQASAHASIDSEDFEWTSGESNLTAYVNKEGLGIVFCKTCGSTMAVVFNGAVCGITLGCVNGDPGVKISRHIYVGSKAAWDVLPEGVLMFEEGPE